MKQYLDLLSHITNTGVTKSDRTGTGTTSVFGSQMRFDLSQGFPLVTTKKIHTKSVIAELLWMLSGSTDNNDLTAENVSIWDEWATPEQCSKQGRADGDLGPMYGSAWRDWTARYVALVEPRIKDKETPITYPLWAMEVPEKLVRKNGAAGRKCETADGLTFTVLREYTPADASRNVYDIQFNGTGYTKIGVSFPALRSGAIVKDHYHPSIFGVACIGDGVGSTAFEKGLYQTWFAMIRRCYDTKHRAYANYGGAGIFVCNRWLVYSRFRQDVSRVRGWRQRRLNPTGVELDKDFYSSNCYSPDTCSWLSQADNTTYTGQALEAITAGGERRWYLSIREAARELGVSTPSVKKGLDTGLQVKGCYFKPLVGSYRLVTYVDQLQWAIDELLKNPDSRRLCITAWNPANSSRVALEACHCLFQFYTEEITWEKRLQLWADATTEEATIDLLDATAIMDAAGIPRRKLSCQLYMRSSDVFLGLPFNIASYALLTHMMAQQCNMAVGDFIWSGGDCHIYSNHKEQVALQLSREPMKLPHLVIKRKPDSLFDYKVEDFEFENYVYHPAIKADVAI